MPEASVSRSALIEWGVATLALPGDGPEAATAAQAAVAALERHSTESPMPLIERCHRALHGTRGAVMSVAVLGRPDRSMTWLGVGNVEGLLLHGDGAARSGSRRESLVTRGGIVGSELPRLHPVVLPIAPGDT